MKVFLRLRNHEIFTLVFGFPILLSVILILTMKMFNNQLLEYRLMIIIPLVCITGFFGWIGSVTHRLQKELPIDIKLKSKFFMFFLWYSFVVFICLTVLLIIDNPMKMDVAIAKQLTVAEKLIQIIFSIISTFFGISLICILYCIYFTAKMIKTAELQKLVTFSDFAGVIVMICLFPIGIWILQPKINKMIKDK